MTKRMRSHPHAILFDLDGVLIESYPVWFHLLNHAARDLGYSEISTEAYEASWGQTTRADRDAFFPNHEVAEVEAFYGAHYAEHFEHLVIPEGVPLVFRRLAELELPSAVCTNSQSALAADAVKRAGATPTVLVGGDDVELGKPAPDMLLRACELLDVSPKNAWMIGDSRYDREASAAARVHFIGRGIDGDARIEDLAELLELI